MSIGVTEEEARGHSTLSTKYLYHTWLLFQVHNRDGTDFDWRKIGKWSMSIGLVVLSVHEANHVMMSRKVPPVPY